MVGKGLSDVWKRGKDGDKHPCPLIGRKETNAFRTQVL